MLPLQTGRFKELFQNPAQRSQILHRRFRVSSLRACGEYVNGRIDGNPASRSRVRLLRHSPKSNSGRETDLTEKNSRRDDRILDPELLNDAASMSTTDLRSRRDEVRELEAEFSYARRLLQGKIDILAAELKRRSEGGEAGMGDLVSRLPSILADEPRSGGATRLLESDLPRNAGKFRRYTERLATGLAHIETSTPEELAAMVTELGAEERKVSEDRRRAQKIIDGLNAELVRRYQKGDEDPSALLSS
jgi:hypothetical protein